MYYYVYYMYKPVFPRIPPHHAVLSLSVCLTSHRPLCDGGNPRSLCALDGQGSVICLCPPGYGKNEDTNLCEGKMDIVIYTNDLSCCYRFMNRCNIWKGVLVVDISDKWLFAYNQW